MGVGKQHSEVPFLGPRRRSACSRWASHGQSNGDREERVETAVGKLRWFLDHPKPGIGKSNVRIKQYSAFYPIADRAKALLSNGCTMKEKNISFPIVSSYC